ncbi:hypothetical protein QWA68_005729 [Fusarium oxysporum]|nr:hypothetical protein QWA68_005729 [Fusarium oxysporum]
MSTTPIQTIVRAHEATSRDYRSRTDGEKEIICKEITEQLINGMRKISTRDRTYLIMAPARDMISMDKDVYGEFSKTEGSAMKADEFDRSVIIDSPGQGSGGSLVPTRLVWTFAEHTERVLGISPSQPLYDFVLPGNEAKNKWIKKAILGR